MSTAKQGVRLTMEKDGNDLVVTIKYMRNVWEMLEKSYIKMGLERYVTRALFGKLTSEVYRYPNDDLINRVLSSVRETVADTSRTNAICLLRIIDDINSPLIQLDTVNMAVFRVVPSCSESECVTMLRIRDGAVMFTKPHLKCFAVAMKYYIQTWLNMSVTVRWRYEVTVEVK